MLLLLGATNVRSQTVTIDSVNTVDPTCGAADGSLTIHATGGTTSLLYSIDSGAFAQTDSTFNNLSPGVYQIFVTDSANFTDTLTFTLYGVNGLSIDNIITTDAVCNGDSTGSVDVQVSGGTGSYTFTLLGNTQTNGMFGNLPAGNYQMFIEDGNFCVDTASFTIGEPLAVTFTATVNDANCPANDGDITINAMGGDGNYTYSIDTGNTFQAGNFFGTLGAATYITVVMDGVGCTDTQTVFVNTASGGPNILTLNFIEPLCNGSNNGSITILATGTPPITYSNDGGTNFQAGGTFTNLPPGSYDVVVIDGNGCPEGNTIVIQEPALLVNTVTAFDETCVGGDGSICFTTTGGTPNYQYSIDDGVNFFSTNCFNNLSGGTYPYVVEDQNGCSDTATIVLNSGGGPTIDSISTIDPSCPLSTDGEIVIHAVTQGTSIAYSIDGGATFFPTDSFPNLGVGTYSIQLVDDNNCTTAASVTLTGPGLTADFTANPTTGFVPLTVDFTDNSIGATGWSWDFGDTSGTSIAQDPTYIYNSAGTFTAVLTVTDGNCTDTASMVIVVSGDPNIDVPNVFTPNGDGLNEFFHAQAVGITDLTGTIYNRWGQIVYYWEGPNGGWDGKTAPAGQPAAEGTYYYVIDAIGFDGTSFQESGIVTLIRQEPLKR